MHKDEVILRPVAERPTFYQDAPLRLRTNSYATREERPPQVVRGSPASHGLQDMLVPSIETASSDAVIDLSRPVLRREGHGGYDYLQESYPRRVERRRQSPEPHQVIFIDDDSPQIKRRRVVHEDDSGHFRPLPSRDQDFYTAAPYGDSYLLPASSVQPRDFLVRRERLPSQSAQGLFRDVQPPLTGPAVGERIPVYDLPPDSSLSAASSHVRRTEVGAGSTQREGPLPYLEKTSEGSYSRWPASEDTRVVEHDRITRQVNPISALGMPFKTPHRPLFLSLAEFLVPMGWVLMLLQTRLPLIISLNPG